jgi:hypothetical protein
MENRYDYGGDEYVFVGFDIEMSLEANFRVLSVCPEIERQQISRGDRGYPGHHLLPSVTFLN